MLQLMLHAHPRIAIPPETRFLLAAYKRRGEWGDLREAANRERLADWITRGKGTNFRDLELDPDAVAAEIVAGPPTLGSAIGIVFRAYARKFDKPRWGDKRPAYLLNIGKLLRMFPDAQIINIIRDGRDCVASLKEQPWHRGGLNEAISTWCRGSDAGQRALRTLPPDTYHQVYYESLVQDPVGAMTAICEFLGEDYHPDMAGPSTMAAIAVPKRKVWHELTHGDGDDRAHRLVRRPARPRGSGALPVGHAATAAPARVPTRRRRPADRGADAQLPTAASTYGRRAYEAGGAITTTPHPARLGRNRSTTSPRA